VAQPSSAQRPPRKSSAQRNAEVRAGLEPIGPDERPLPLVIATAVAVALGLTNIVLLIAGQNGQPAQLVVYCALVLGAAYGMWTKRYAAVLAFQVLLAIAVVIGFLFLLRASSLLDLLICFALIVPTGWLFWKLVRILARLQTPVEPRADDR
jgi:predicted neutral ceramidase superfamily lipid hydrolase